MRKSYEPFRSDNSATFWFAAIVVGLGLGGILMYKHCQQASCARLEIRLIPANSAKPEAAPATADVQSKIPDAELTNPPSVWPERGVTITPADANDDAWLKQPSGPVKNGPTTLERLKLADAIQKSVKRPAPTISGASGSGEEATLAHWDGLCAFWGYEYGTVKYRECRGKVSQDLRSVCNKANWQAQQMNASEGRKRSARELCYAERHFKVID